jgi:hypothetical protein
MIKKFCKIIWSFRLNSKKYRKRLRMKIETNPFKRVIMGALLTIQLVLKMFKREREKKSDMKLYIK